MFVAEKDVLWFRYAKDHIHAKLNVADIKQMEAYCLELRLMSENSEPALQQFLIRLQFPQLLMRQIKVFSQSESVQESVVATVFGTLD